MTLLLLQVLVGAAIAGLVQGLSGFAFGLVAMGVWAWSVSPQLTGPMVVFGSLVGQLLSIHSVRADIDLRRVLPFILGGVVGVPLGAAALPHLDATLFKAGVGVLLVKDGVVYTKLPSKKMAEHGGAFDSDRRVAFVMAGPGPKSGAGVDAKINIFSTAPTLAKLMGLSLPTATSPVLTEAPR